MKITYYLYNAFTIESGDKKIAIDPGGLFCYFFRFSSLIPRSQWSSITHILVTHGDPDHYWHADRIAELSGAPIICHNSMKKIIKGKTLFLGPRSKGLAFTTEFKKYFTVEIGKPLEIDGMSITGIKTTHGPLKIQFGPISLDFKPSPNERIRWGSMGFYGV